MAASKIQSHFRALVDYRLIQAYKVLMVVAATRVQTQIRGFLAKSFLDWIIRNGIAATEIQRVIRGFLARPLLKILKLNAFAQCRVATVKTHPIVALQKMISRRKTDACAYQIEPRKSKIAKCGAETNSSYLSSYFCSKIRSATIKKSFQSG